MDPQVRLLFHEVADLPREQRERLFAARKVAAEVRAEVESLLGFDSSGRHRLTGCVADAAGEMLQSAGLAEPAACGPYRLIRQLGAGGMGAVYLAERRDGEIQQQVAIKLLRSGPVPPAWQERFLRERQLLAYLNHPSIARLLDAGRTPDGQPYLVMEYVDGLTIDAYAAGKHLREQLTLFLAVCAGVAHAHRHLIIHRDLKPSNILVDTTGQPKLLDFGIAKLLDEDQTQTVERMLTPQYASPEQLRGALQTTATDIYSLGAVLYKLLTGRSPHESQTPGGASAADISSLRRLNPEIPPDVASILRMALREEPEERYTSVDAFANDLRAYLDSRPVQARSGNVWYRTRKFARRYWIPVTATTLVLLSLSAGLYIANRERTIAQTRFSELRQLSNRVFALDRDISSLPGATQARQRLVAASLQYLAGLASAAHGDLDLSREIGEGYWRVARVQGVPVGLNLGQPAQAEANLKKAEGFIDAVLAARPTDRLALYRSAYIAHDRLILAVEEHRWAGAPAEGRKAVERMDAFLKVDSRDSARNEASALYENVALAYLNMHRYREAIPLARRAVELARTLRSGGRRLSATLSVLATSLRFGGDPDEALGAIREARAILNRSPSSNWIDDAFQEYGILIREGQILGEIGSVNLGRPAEAVEPLQKAVDLMEQVARKDPHDFTSRTRLAEASVNLARIVERSDPPRALALYDAAIRRLRENPANLMARRDLAEMLAFSSYPLRRLRRAGDSRQRLARALALLHETQDLPANRIPLDSAAYTVLSAEADSYGDPGDLARAIQVYEDLLQKVIAAKPDLSNDLIDAPAMSRLYESLAALYRQAGAASKAADLDGRRMALWRHWDEELPNNSFVRRQLAR